MAGAIYHSYATHIAVVVQIGVIGAGTEYFRKSSCGGKGLKFHLPQAEFCMQVSLNEIEVIIVLCKHMRHHTIVEIYLHFVFELWKIQVDISVGINRFCI